MSLSIFVVNFFKRKILGTNKETQVESEEANSVSSVETNLT